MVLFWASRGVARSEPHEFDLGNELPSSIDNDLRNKKWLFPWLCVGLLKGNYYH